MAENVTYTLKVNGTSYTVTADSGLPLLWLLRDVVGLTGTKYGCGITQCKACSVIVNGVMVRSIAHEICTMLAMTGTTSVDPPARTRTKRQSMAPVAVRGSYPPPPPPSASGLKLSITHATMMSTPTTTASNQSATPARDPVGRSSA